MEYIDTSFCSSLATHSNFGSCQDGWSDVNIDWLNLTASDDDESSHLQIENNRHDAAQTRMTRLSKHSSSTTHQPQTGKAMGLALNGKRTSKSYPNDNAVKRRRGPNKNQKILTEEERKKKKAKALCRNAESARTCRGKRKQAEEKLKIKSANMEREFQMLCRTREALGQELFDLLEQARGIKDPLITKAVEQAAVRLSSSMTHGRVMQKLLDLRLQQLPFEPLLSSRRNSNSSTLQISPIVPHTTVASAHHSSTTMQQLYENNTAIESHNQQAISSEDSLSSFDLVLDLSKSRRGSSTNDSSSQNDARISSISTPVSDRKNAIVEEDASGVIQQLSGSPNPFMGDAMSQNFENSNFTSILSDKSSSFMESQLHSEQKRVDFVYLSTPISHCNEPPSTPLDSHLLMQRSPSSLDTATFNHQVSNFSFPQTFLDQASLKLPGEDYVPSDLESAIAQLVNFA